jgi:hypothetical protein
MLTNTQRLLQEMEAIRTADCRSHAALRWEYSELPERTILTMMAYFEAGDRGHNACSLLAALPHPPLPFRRRLPKETLTIPL